MLPLESERLQSDRALQGMSRPGPGVVPALEAAGISKRYGDRYALRSAGLTVEERTVHGIVGTNGAGKSTLLRIFLGLVRRDSGTVRLLGRGFEGGPIPDGVAGLVDSPGFYPYLSARRNLELFARMDSSSSSDDTVHRSLAESGLSECANLAVGGFSAGMRQRLGLAAALMRSPKLLLLDEPTSALDPMAAAAVRARLRALALDGAAVVITSHDMAEVEDLCDRVTIIDAGRVLYAGPTADLRQFAPEAGHHLRTSDDRAALAIAPECAGVLARAVDDGLQVTGAQSAIDAYIITLGRCGIAVRALDTRGRSLESIVLQLPNLPVTSGATPALSEGPS